MRIYDGTRRTDRKKGTQRKRRRNKLKDEICIREELGIRELNKRMVKHYDIGRNS